MLSGLWVLAQVNTDLSQLDQAAGGCLSLSDVLQDPQALLVGCLRTLVPAFQSGNVAQVADTSGHAPAVAQLLTEQVALIQNLFCGCILFQFEQQIRQVDAGDGLSHLMACLAKGIQTGMKVSASTLQLAQRSGNKPQAVQAEPNGRQVAELLVVGETLLIERPGGAVFPLKAGDFPQKELAMCQPIADVISRKDRRAAIEAAARLRQLTKIDREHRLNTEKLPRQRSDWVGSDLVVIRPPQHLQRLAKKGLPISERGRELVIIWEAPAHRCHDFQVPLLDSPLPRGKDILHVCGERAHDPVLRNTPQRLVVLDDGCSIHPAMQIAHEFLFARYPLKPLVNILSQEFVDLVAVVGHPLQQRSIHQGREDGV